MYRDKRISLVIPAHNEEKLIKPTLENVPSEIDIIFVIDDASTDNTIEIIKSSQEKDERIVLIQHETNQGVGASIINGYRHTAKENYDIAVVVGGDYQMPLEQVRDFLDPLIDGKADYTKGNRFIRQGLDIEKMPALRLIGNALISAITKVASGYYKTYDVVDGYTAITREAIEIIDWNKAWKGYGYPMDFLIRLNGYGLRILEVPRRAIYLEGERQSQIKGFRYALKVSPMLIRGFFWRLTWKYLYKDFHPLVFFYFLGSILFPSGFLWGLFLIYQQLSGYGVSGPRAILCALMLIMGSQFLLFAMFFDMQESL